MGDPVTWMVVAATALKAGGTIMETQSARSEADTEAKVAGVNADLASSQAGQAEDAQRRQNREVLARQRAAVGESGFTSGGSFQKVEEQSAVEAELDALNIRYGGQLRRQGSLVQRDTAKARGKAITRSGYMKAAGQLLGGGADAYQSSAQYGKP